MKKAILICFILFVNASFAENKSVFTKGDSLLKLAKSEHEYHNKWVGRINLIGKLVLEFERTDEFDMVPTSLAVFEPDNESIKKLPHAIGDFYPLQIKKIYLNKSPKELLNQIYDVSKVNKIIKGKKQHYEIDSVLTISTFETSLDCDHRSYYAKVSSIRLKTPHTLVLAKNDAENFGC
jgi:hypothetical protein